MLTTCCFFPQLLTNAEAPVGYGALLHALCHLISPIAQGYGQYKSSHVQFTGEKTEAGLYYEQVMRRYLEAELLVLSAILFTILHFLFPHWRLESRNEAWSISAVQIQ